MNGREKNPDFKEIENKQDYFAHTLSAIAKDTKTIDEKVIKNVFNNIYKRRIRRLIYKKILQLAIIIILYLFYLKFKI